MRAVVDQSVGDWEEKWRVLGSSPGVDNTWKVLW